MKVFTILKVVNNARFCIVTRSSQLLPNKGSTTDEALVKNKFLSSPSSSNFKREGVVAPNFKRQMTGSSRHGCSVCGKKFSTNQTLKVHSRIHSGDKKFKRNKYGKEFNVRSNLRTHKLTHTGDRWLAL